MKSLDIAIAGAGIGGLTAAVALQRAGYRVRVYEQAPRLLQVGAGLSLSPTAAHGLRAIGLGPALDELAYSPDTQFIRNGIDGKIVSLASRGEALFQRVGERYYLIHRAELHEALAVAARAHDPATIVLDHKVERVITTGPRVRFVFADGRETEADVLIAADGQRSGIRQSLFSPDAPQFSGYVAWRTLIPMSRLAGLDLEPRSGIFIGPERKMNVYPVQRGATLNFVAFAEREAWFEEGWSIPATVAELEQEFASWSANATSMQIIGAIRAGEVYKWGLFDRAPLALWHREHVALLGDAAHPVLPFLGHGAVLAIEDGVVLARAFAASSSVPEALSRYQRARYERAAFVHAESRKAVRTFHAAQPTNYSQATRNQSIDEGLGLFDYNPALCAV